MSRYDFSQPGRREPAKGFRTKKARRRAAERQRVHKLREQQAQGWKRARRRETARRREEGWWPPVSGQMSPAPGAHETSYRERRNDG